MSNDDQKIIYSMIKVSKNYNSRPVLKNISLSYFHGAKIGVLGLNGSGKSTLLRILAGIDSEFDGRTVLAPGYTIDYLEQEPALDPDKTVREIVEQGVADTLQLIDEFNSINEQFAEPMSDDEMQALIDKQAEVQEKLDSLSAWDIDSRLEMAMDALRCPPSDTKCGILSGGEQRRVALCRILLKKPDILLLDEPTNHLDAETVAWLERHLQDYPVLNNVALGVSGNFLALDPGAADVFQRLAGPLDAPARLGPQRRDARVRDEGRHGGDAEDVRLGCWHSSRVRRLPRRSVGGQ